MKMPGFNAEASMYRTNKTYQSEYGSLVAGTLGTVIPQGWEWKCQWVWVPDEPRDCSTMRCQPPLVCCDCIGRPRCTTREQCDRECRF